MSDSNGTVVGSGFGIAFKAAGSGQGHQRGASADLSPASVQKEGCMQLLVDVLRHAGLNDRRWEVLVVQTFVRTTKIPTLSNFLPDEQHKGVKFRFMSKRHRGWILVLIAPGGVNMGLNELAAKLRQAAKIATGEEPEPRRSPPTSAEIVREAVKAVERLEAGQTKGYRWASFDLFVRAVAEDVGPDEEVGYWKEALERAYQEGQLKPGSNCYLTPARWEAQAPPPEPKVTPAAQRAADIEAATPITAGAAGRPRDDQVDEEALSLLIGAADTIEEKLKKLKGLKNQRADLKNQLDQARRRVREAEEALAENAAQIKDAAKGISLGDLMESAAFLS